MKSMTTLAGVLLTLAALAAAIYGVYLAVAQVWQLFAGLDATLRLVLLSSFAVVLAGCSILGGAIKSAARTNLKGHWAEQRLQLYTRMVAVLEQYLSDLASRSTNADCDPVAHLDEMESEISLMAGGPVITARRKLETAIREGRSEEVQRGLYRQLIRRMREDLGQVTPMDESGLTLLSATERRSKNDSSGEGVNA